MITYLQAQQIISETVRPNPVRTVELLEADGHILGEDVSAMMDQPPFDRSPLDGYAFRAADSAAENAVLTVSALVPAGESSLFTLKPGEAARVFTGAMLPSGADAVAAQEEVQVEGNRIRLPRPYMTGENVVRAGDDMAAGTPLLKAGGPLGPVELALAASQGLQKLPVYEKPSVALLCTGSELREPGIRLKPGTIYNSNLYLVASLLKRCGLSPVFTATYNDNPDMLTEGLKKALAQADLVVTTGGVSVGDYDVVPAAVSQAGAEILFHRVAVKPGTPTLAARYRGKMIICLSGNPTACLTGFLLFALPVIKRMSGQMHPFAETATAVLAGEVRNQSRQDCFYTGYAYSDNGFLIAVPAGRQKPGSMTAMRGMNSLLHLPAQTAMGRNEKISLHMFHDLFM